MKRKILLLSIIVFTLCMFVGTSSYAVWWGVPSYEYALKEGYTSAKTQAQLNKNVTVSDYYNIILKYLSRHNVVPKDKIVQSAYVDGIYNGAIDGMLKQVNTYITTENKITPQQYRELAELVDHTKSMMTEYSNYLTRDDLKNINLYLDLAKYRGAMLLSENSKVEREYRSNILYSLRNTKYHNSLTYGIMPMTGRIKRGDFFVLMYNLLSDKTTSSNDIIRDFYESGVIQGYSSTTEVLGLDNEVTYIEMFKFFQKIDTYDFNSVEEDIEEDTTNENVTVNEEA